MNFFFTFVNTLWILPIIFFWKFIKGNLNWNIEDGVIWVPTLKACNCTNSLSSSFFQNLEMVLNLNSSTFIFKVYNAYQKEYFEIYYEGCPLSTMTFKKIFIIYTNSIFWENSKLWRPFSHRKSCFFKKLWTKRSCELKLTFIEKNLFVISTFHSKVMVKNQSQSLKELFFDIFKHCLWFLFILLILKLKLQTDFC